MPALQRHEAQGGGERFGVRELAGLGRGHGRAAVNQNLAADVLLSLVYPYVQLISPRRHVPVDAPLIVTRMVLSEVGELQAQTRAWAAQITVARAGQRPSRHEPQALQFLQQA